MDTNEHDSYKKIINKLISLVSNGTLKPNEKIYSENRLAQILNVPRAQVREVYTALRILGIIYGKQGEGTYFRPVQIENEPKILYLMTLMENSKFENIISMRKILETGSAELAALNRTDNDLSPMKECLYIMEHTGDPLIMAVQDAAFHFKIAEASGNPLVKTHLNIIFGYISKIMKDHWQQIITRKQNNAQAIFFKQHRQILEAIEKQQSALAEKEMRKHMDSLIENMLSTMEVLDL